MTLDGSHNLQVLRGLSTNRSLLSCNGDGSVVDLWGEDDGSGRQVWEISLVPGHTDAYHIIVSKGVSGDRKYLSCTQDGSKVDLWNEDDNSGRQRWQFVPVQSPICTYYNIKVDAGVTGGRTLLSCTPDGSTVDLWNVDDGSGRQRWQVQ
jgi:hypothetical protein